MKKMFTVISIFLFSFLAEYCCAIAPNSLMQNDNDFENKKISAIGFLVQDHSLKEMTVKELKRMLQGVALKIQTEVLRVDEMRQQVESLESFLSMVREKQELSKGDRRYLAESVNYFSNQDLLTRLHNMSEIFNEELRKIYVFNYQHQEYSENLVHDLLDNPRKSVGRVGNWCSVLLALSESPSESKDEILDGLELACKDIRFTFEMLEHVVKMDGYDYSHFDPNTFYHLNIYYALELLLSPSKYKEFKTFLNYQHLTQQSS